jgi:hypothetical protein
MAATLSADPPATSTSPSLRLPLAAATIPATRTTVVARPAWRSVSSGRRARPKYAASA